VAVRDGRVLVLGYIGETEYVTALDEGSGRRLWSAPIGEAVEEHPSMRWFSSRTPTVDRDLLYAFRGDAKLVCLRTQDGAEVWRKDYVSEYGTERSGWGHSDYPLIDGGRLICSPCGSRATVVALDKATGREVWTTKVPGPAQQAFGAAVVMTAGGVREFVMQTHSKVFGIRDRDGAILWEMPASRQEPYEVVSATPVVMDDRFVIVSRWNLPTRMVRLEVTPEGIRPKEVFSIPVRVAIQDDSAVALDSYLYGVLQSGLFCIRADSGQKVWSAPLRGDMRSFTVAEGFLYLYSSTTQVSLIEPTPEGLRIGSSFFLPGPPRLLGAANPVVTGGRLYLRDEDRLFCFDVRDSGTLESTPPSEPVALERPKGAGERHPPAVYVATPPRSGPEDDGPRQARSR
jgi:hypothetical protein